MQVNDRSSYISDIYSAIVVNDNVDLDPKGRGRFQIYIPKVHFNYIDDYKSYMNDEYKEDNPLFSVFPWAKTLDDTLTNGDYVYGSYIDGDPSKFIILGIDASPDYMESGWYSSVTNLNDLSRLTDYAMGIILHNEIGVNTDAWKDDDISNSKYATITLHDGGQKDASTGQWIKPGSWSIGLLQWNGARAYTTFYAIVSRLADWRDYFEDLNKNNNLLKALESSLLNKSTSGQSYKFHDNYNPEKNGDVYNVIKNILKTSTSKTVQREIAYNDTYSIVKMLYDNGCDNPAILIFMADFFNQYGSGHPETIRMCAKACTKKELSTMEQLDWLIKNQLKKVFSDYSKYTSRRNGTYNYIEDLLNNGKIRKAQLTDETYNYTTNFGTYSMPFSGNAYISATWGKYGYSRLNSQNSYYHTGIDFAFPVGRKLYASMGGTISVLSEYNKTGPNYGFGMALKIMADDGNMIVYGHMSSFVRKSGRVEKGELIGYSGNTGNSTGAHLHFEVRKSPYKYSKAGTGDDINPLPLLGLQNVKKDSNLF